MRNYIILLTLVFSQLIWGSSITDGDLANIRMDIQRRILNIVELEDSNARVDISFQMSKSKTKSKKDIIENPFILSSIPVEGKSAKERIFRTNILLISKFNKDTFPKELNSKIKTITREYSQRYSLKFQTIAPPAAKNYLTQLNELNVFQRTLIYLIVMSFAILIAFLGLGIVRKKQVGASENLGPVITEAVNSLKESMENIANHNMRNQDQFPQISRPMSFEINTGSESFFKDLTSESLNEIFMDCYWAQEDEYAAYLWSKLDVSTKSRILASNKRMGEYANYISNLSGHDAKYINETYYFNPLSLGDISNEKLTELVKKYQSIFHLLPKIRISHLKIDATEKRKLMLKKYSKQDTEFELQSINWDEYKTTESRSFDSSYVFYFESLEEEEKFFNEGKIDFSLVQSFPSLVWLTYLREDDILDILQPFTAKELSVAWEGPENVLSKLEKVLPEKKIELLKSYQQHVSPDRRSTIFNDILKKTAEALQARQAERTA